MRAVANAIAAYVDKLGVVWVEGQVAQLSRRQGLATVFLTLRDPVADLSISVTCSRSLFDGLNPPVVEGASIVVQAKPSFYATRGTLSLQARDIRTVGLGELLARIERRRQLLAAEGLFALELKRPLPFLPGTVGLVTAPGSDAERDVIENARRRWPSVEVKVAAARMQGRDSALEVVEAVRRLDKDPAVDVIVIARGGGSVEDLLPFSDEAVIRAVHAARTPVVSAIGHEADSPLLDLVADVRASTPTDAARRVVPDMAEETARVAMARDRLRSSVRGWLDREQAALTAIRTRPVDGRPPLLGRRPSRRARRAPRPGPPHPAAPARPGERRRTPPRGAGRGALAAGHPAPGVRRAPGRRRARADLGRRRDDGRRRVRPGRRRPAARHHHPHRDLDPAGRARAPGRGSR